MRSNSVTRKFGGGSWHRWCRTAIGCALAVLAGTSAGLAQMPSGYPTKPVRLVVPYGAGGVGDQTMRLLANSLSQQLKQQFVIENRPSAGGIISMTEVLRAPADGYTLGEMGNGQAISMSLFSNLHYDLLKDFVPISVAASFSMLLAVPDGAPYKSLPELVAAARNNPGKINLGAINPGSPQNLSTHLFKQTTRAARQGERVPELCGQQLERHRRPRRGAGRDHQLSQRRDQPQPEDRGHPGEISCRRDRSERQHAGRDVGPDDPRQPQMARGDREGRHPQAIMHCPAGGARHRKRRSDGGSA